MATKATTKKYWHVHVSEKVYTELKKLSLKKKMPMKHVMDSLVLNPKSK